MKNYEITISDLSKLSSAVRNILELATDKKIFAFYGDMGSGKTTLIKEICNQLGSTDNFSSPTYSIVNEYLAPGSSGKIYHVDLYRIENTEEAMSAGVQEYLDSGSYCFIEWPGLIEPLLPDDVVKISISTDDNIRNLTIFIK